MRTFCAMAPGWKELHFMWNDKELGDILHPNFSRGSAANGFPLFVARRHFVAGGFEALRGQRRIGCVMRVEWLPGVNGL